MIESVLTCARPQLLAQKYSSLSQDFRNSKIAWQPLGATALLLMSRARICFPVRTLLKIESDLTRSSCLWVKISFKLTL